MIASRTRTWAVATAVAFVIGTIAVPTLHLVFHTLPHDHEGGEIHYHFTFDDHDHDAEDGDHHHATESAEEEEHHHDGDHDHQPFDPHHGEGSAAHFSLAINDAAASAVDLALVGLAKQGWVAPRREVLHASSDVSAVRLRGPPVS